MPTAARVKRINIAGDALSRGSNQAAARQRNLRLERFARTFIAVCGTDDLENEPALVALTRQAREALQ